jgi:hypothetical protein
MARLIHSETGVVVNVADEKVERFDALWSPVDEPKKPTTRKAASSNSRD